MISLKILGRELLQALLLASGLRGPLQLQMHHSCLMAIFSLCVCSLPSFCVSVSVSKFPLFTRMPVIGLGGLGIPFMRSPWWLSSKEPAWQCRRHRFDPWVRKMLWKGNSNLLQYSWLGKSHGQRSLAGYCPWSLKSWTSLKWLNSSDSTLNDFILPRLPLWRSYLQVRSHSQIPRVRTLVYNKRLGDKMQPITLGSSVWESEFRNYSSHRKN